MTKYLSLALLLTALGLAASTPASAQRAYGGGYYGSYGYGGGGYPDEGQRTGSAANRMEHGY